VIYERQASGSAVGTQCCDCNTIFIRAVLQNLEQQHCATEYVKIFLIFLAAH
jgi:hypothetical protein